MKYPLWVVTNDAMSDSPTNSKYHKAFEIILTFLVCSVIFKIYFLIFVLNLIVSVCNFINE